MVAGLVRAGVSPNQITLAALAGSLAVGALLQWGPADPRGLAVLPAWFLVRMALNAMDGMAAREHGRTSSLGGVLNEVGDVLADVALVLPLARFLPGPWPAVALALGALLTEFCGLLGPALGVRRQYQGPMGKSDRALVMGALGLLAAVRPATLAWWPGVFLTAAALTAVTAWNRATAALREAGRA